MAELRKEDLWIMADKLKIIWICQINTFRTYIFKIYF